MARKKVNLAWIANDSTRRATLKKRRKGLMKKVSELSTLCDVKACMIVFAPQEPQAEVWPSAPEALRVIERFKSLPEMEQCKKMMNQEAFLRGRVAKLQEQLRKQERENRELETTLLMHRGLAGSGLGGVRIEDVTSLAWMVDIKAKLVHDRIERMVANVQEASAPAEMAPPAVALLGEKITPIETAMEGLERQNWFMEDMSINDPNLMFGAGEEEINMPSYLDNGKEEINMPSYLDNGNAWFDPYLPLN